MDEQQLRQHFAGQALTGILSSPRWSSTLLDMKDDEPRANENEASAKYVMGVLASIAWNIAEAMIVEGRERGVIDTP